MPKKKTEVNLDFAFYQYLRKFYIENRTNIRKSFTYQTKRFLDFNDPENRNSFLRTPQFEALETYVLLKEFLNNAPLHKIFNDWFKKKEGFQNRTDTGLYDLFGELNQDQYKQVFERIQSSSQTYSNYIFALTMGTGKTILMATCIFYEFILAAKFPEDKRYCHNALVFAPDKTVLQSLKEIQTFDKSKVIPKEYVNWLNTNVKFFFLEESGIALSTIDRSKYNIIISNTQKIILKKQHKEKELSDKLFASDMPVYKPGSVYEKYKELYDIEDEKDLISNQRFTKLTRIEQLGVYVDEAHHAFGDRLSGDLTSLRLTIDELQDKLNAFGTKLVACYNYTGTPYVGNQVLPEVVYAYGLNDAIVNKYLKLVDIHSYDHTKDLTFVRSVLEDFWNKHKGKRYEGILPKIAFFASTIDEIKDELQPRVEKIMAELKISHERLLINVGDDSITSNDDLREFNKLDTPDSEKQIILLCNKGKEGWNCRSLFSVALFRRPKSKIFVLQATMRAMRSIGEVQETADIHMTEENKQILAKELEANFKLDIKDLQNIGKDKKTYQIRLVPPPIIVPMKRTRKLFSLTEKTSKHNIRFGLNEADFDRYKAKRTTSKITNLKRLKEEKDITILEEKRVFSCLSLVAEIARYLNRSCLEIENLVKESVEGIDEILNIVNQYNDILYDFIIPSIFNYIFEINSYDKVDEEKVALINEPAYGFYEMNCKPELVVECCDPLLNKYKEKSFHLDHYCFDSMPEKEYFQNQLVSNQDIKNIWFTGMFKHGQTDFFVNYIDPESHTLRSYYPDFLIKRNDNSYEIVEVKGDNKIDDPVVVAKKEAAERITNASKMTYSMIKSSEVLMRHPKEEIQQEILIPIEIFASIKDSDKFTTYLPVYSMQAAAGKFLNNETIDEEGWVMVKRKKLYEDMFVAKVVGHSMEPKIPADSYCVFRKYNGGSRNNLIVLAKYSSIADPDSGGSFTVKMYKSEKKANPDDTWQHIKITLEPINKAYESIQLPEGEEEGFEIIAEFIEVLN